MTAAAIVLSAVAICGLPWLRWAVAPVAIAYELGRLTEKLRQARRLAR